MATIYTWNYVADDQNDNSFICMTMNIGKNAHKSPFFQLSVLAT